MDLRQKHVLITGGVRRVGRALSLGFAVARANVTAHYFEAEDEARELEREAQKSGVVLRTVQADLRDVAQIPRLVDQAAALHGPVDVLVHGASLFLRAPAGELTAADLDSMYALNLRAPILLAEEWKRHLGRRPGVMIGIGDAFALRPMPNYPAYAATKRGFTTWCLTAARQWAPQVRVNTVNPGPVAPDARLNEAMIERLAKKTALGRWGSPADVAEAALFIARNDYLNGIELNVDGGMT